MSPEWSEDEKEEILGKALEVIDKRDAGEIPEELSAIVKDREVTTRDNVFGGKSKYGKPDDPYLTITFGVTYGGAEIEEGHVNIPVSSAPRSALSKFKALWGNPEPGTDIKVFQNDNGYWELDFSELDDD